MNNKNQKQTIVELIISHADADKQWDSKVLIPIVAELLNNKTLTSINTAEATNESLALRLLTFWGAKAKELSGYKNISKRKKRTAKLPEWVRRLNKAKQLLILNNIPTTEIDLLLKCP